MSSEACLSSLYVDNSRYEKISPEYEHTFEWLWTSKEYISWLSWDKSSPNILHIQGKPGSGKSTIVRYFRDHISRILHEVTIASFFVDHRGGEHEQSHEAMLRAILFQLFSEDKTLFGPVFQREYRRNGGRNVRMPSPLPQSCVSDKRSSSRHLGGKKLLRIGQWRACGT